MHSTFRATRLPIARLLALVGLLGLCAAASSLSAQSTSGTGTVSGRSLNPVTGEYVRNAEISVRGTAITTVSADDGTYRLSGVPAGEAVVVVNYTGSGTSATNVTVTAGQTVTRDIQIVSGLSGSATGTKEEVLKLQAFTVSSEREGNAKAIMDQRNSMNITRPARSISS